MKKLLFMVLMVSLLLFNISSCIAFPFLGKYVSEERAIDTMSGEEIKDYPLWRLDINQANRYYGKIEWWSKGVWVGNWSTPLNIEPNQENRYVLEANDTSGYARMQMDIQETSANSFIMYIKFFPKGGYQERIAHMSKVE